LGHATGRRGDALEPGTDIRSLLSST
jgi:hypothetical protein